jgi:hypothetical protein
MHVRFVAVLVAAAALAMLALAPSAQATPPIKLDTGRINFGKVPVSGVSREVKVIVTNNTDHNVTLFTSIDGPTSEMSLTFGSPFCSQGEVVAPGGFCVLNTRYDPSELGRDKGTLIVSDNTDAYDKQVGMSGTGVN